MAFRFTGRIEIPNPGYENPDLAPAFKATLESVRFVIEVFQSLGVRNVQSRHEVGFWEVSGDGCGGNWHAVGLVMRQFGQDFHIGLQQLFAELTYNGWLERDLEAKYNNLFQTDVDVKKEGNNEGHIDPDLGDGI